MSRPTHIDGRIPRTPRRSGFTIVEAVVVLSVIGILSAVAAPRFLSTSELDSVRAHRQALADLRYAQRRGAGSGCPVQVDFEATRYTLTQRTGCRSGAFTLPVVDPVTNAAGYSVDLPAGVTITSSLDPLVFDALGRITTTAGAVSDATIAVAGRALEGVGETGLVRAP